MASKFFYYIYAYALENEFKYGKARVGAILPKLFRHGLDKKDIKKIMPEIEQVIKEISNLSDDVKKKIFEKQYKQYIKESDKPVEGLKDLPGIKGKKKLVFRMAPFPSGPLHIGNMKTYLLNALYAERYKGKILLVIDDTIGSEDKGIVFEAYGLIPEAFDFLKVKYKKPILYKSDRLKIYYQYAEKLIRKGKAYVDYSPKEEMRDRRAKGIESPHRKLDVKTQLERWKKMFKAKEGSAVLRIKTDMKHKNPAFRDRVIFRISDRNHTRVGKKYRVWPLLDFSWAIDDHLLKVTHVIRGKELMIEGEMQKYIWDIFKWKHPEMIYVGLVKLEGIAGKLSKSKSQKEVLSGRYKGWDDPRTWSVQSLERRGILASSLREFVEKIGLNQKDITIPIDDLYAINRRKIDSKANRYFFVEDAVKIKIDKNLPKEVKTKIHPEKTKKKTIKIEKEIFVSKTDFNDFKGKEVRLMHLFNIKLDKKSEFTSKENNSKIRKIHWVGKSLKTKVLMPNGIWAKGLAESNIIKLKKGEEIQFERFGFCRFDGINRHTKDYEFWYTHD